MVHYDDENQTFGVKLFMKISYKVDDVLVDPEGNVDLNKLYLEIISTNPTLFVTILHY